MPIPWSFAPRRAIKINKTLSVLKNGRFRIGIKLRTFYQAVSMKASWIRTPISQVNPFPLFHPNLNQITFYHFNQNQTLLCLISSLDGWQLRTFGFLLPVSFPQYDSLFLFLWKSIVHQKKEAKISFDDAERKENWKIEILHIFISLVPWIALMWL